MDILKRLGSTVLSELCFLNGIFARMDLRYALVGATALLLHGVDLPRITQDLDVVVAMEGDFADLLTKLTTFGFQRTRIPHRLLSPQDIQLDVLPVTEKSARTGVIEWPDGNKMSAVGLNEALAHAEDIQLSTCTVCVAPLPILAGLKLIASASDQRRGKGDVNDFLECLAQFELQGERRFSVCDLTDTELIFDQAGAFLLGYELKKAAQPPTLQAINDVLQNMDNESGLNRHWRSEEEAEDLLRIFRVGFGS